MGNPHYSELPEQNYTGPRDRSKTADTTGASRKSQPGGWRTSSNKSPASPGKDTSGWACSTRKSSGSTTYRTSTTKTKGVG